MHMHRCTCASGPPYKPIKYEMRKRKDEERELAREENNEREKGGERQIGEREGEGKQRKGGYGGNNREERGVEGQREGSREEKKRRGRKRRKRGRRQETNMCEGEKVEKWMNKSTGGIMKLNRRVVIDGSLAMIVQFPLFVLPSNLWCLEMVSQPKIFHI